MTAFPRTLARLLTALVVTLGLVSAVPSTASAAAGTGTITGVITDTQGNRLKGVTIASRIPEDVTQPAASATTAADGSYSLKVPADAGVQVCARATGRIPTCFDSTRGFVIDRTPSTTPWAGVGTRLDVAAGATRRGIDFQVPAPAHIRGLLTDTAGRPVAGVAVQAFTDDVRGNDDRASAVSNSAGRYDIALTGQLDSPVDYCLDVAAAADDGYARVRRYQTDQGDGNYFGCERTVSAGAILTDNVTLTADGTSQVKNLATPYFVGTPKVGYRLAARPGRWEPAGVSLTYAWFDGSRLIGTGPTYVVRAAELGHPITIVATAVAAGRVPTARSWTKADRVVRGTFWIRARPTISGARKVGHRLRARPATSTPVARRTYRWLRNGKPIKGATSSRYRVRTADRHQRLTVRVTYSRSAYDPASRTSARTHSIRK